MPGGFYRINGIPMHIKFGGRVAAPAPCKCCGSISEFLCDYPVGTEGHTCSMPLCRDCRRPMGKLDFCPKHQHADLFDHQGDHA